MKSVRWKPGAAIIAGFAELQNPIAEEFPAFAALAKKRPEPFMHAAKRMCLTSSRQSNFDWIEAALHAAKADDRCMVLDDAHTSILAYVLFAFARSADGLPPLPRSRGES